MNWGCIGIIDPDTPIKARRLELGLSKAECSRRYTRVMGHPPAKGKPSISHWNFVERTGLRKSSAETRKAVAEVLETTIEHLTAT